MTGKTTRQTQEPTPERMPRDMPGNTRAGRERWHFQERPRGRESLGLIPGETAAEGAARVFEDRRTVLEARLRVLAVFKDRRGVEQLEHDTLLGLFDQEKRKFGSFRPVRYTTQSGLAVDTAAADISPDSSVLLLANGCYLVSSEKYQDGLSQAAEPTYRYVATARELLETVRVTNQEYQTA